MKRPSWKRDVQSSRRTALRPRMEELRDRLEGADRELLDDLLEWCDNADRIRRAAVLMTSRAGRALRVGFPIERRVDAEVVRQKLERIVADGESAGLRSVDRPIATAGAPPE